MYAVKKGINPGIYNTWEECKANVIGVSGSIYKKCKTLEDATQFCNENKSIKLCDKLYDKEKCSDIVNVYTDGSLIKKNGYESCGYGIYIPKYNIKIGNILKKNKTNNRAELIAIIDAIQYLIKKQEKNICIYTDSTYSILIFGNTGKKYEKKGYKNVKNCDLVKKVNQLQKQDINLSFHHVRAHSGNIENENDIGNDIVDEIANYYAVKDYIEQNIEWKNTLKVEHKNIKELSTKYLTEYINKKSYIALCKKNASKRTQRHLIINYLKK
jgi:ribonuclease HI